MLENLLVFIFIIYLLPSKFCE